MVSVIITTHNRRQLLERAVNSVLNQTYKDIDLVIVDDNSTDDTDDYLKNISSLENVQVIRLSGADSRGGNHARNVGIKAATGDYIAFLDDDDEWLPTKIEKQMAVFQDNSDVGMVYCGHYYEYELIDTSRSEAFVSGKMNGDLSLECFTKIICFTSSMIVKASVLNEVGVFDEELNFWQETELNIRISNNTKVGYVNEPLFVYRIIRSDKNRLSNKYEQWWSAISYIEKKHKVLFDKLPEEIKKKWKILVYNDAASRCKNAGLKKEERKNRWEVFKYSHDMKDLVKFLFLINEFPAFLRRLKHKV